jgi:hypothetical protein
MAYAHDDEDVQVWTPDQPFPLSVTRAILAGERLYCHNAAFERLVFWYVLCPDHGAPEPALEQFYCTATQARANCAPGSLEDVGRFAGADMKKDHRGAQLVRKCCCPPFKHTPQDLADLFDYCAQDVRAMRAISKALRPLSAEELADYHTNELINDRGVLVDVDLAKAAQTYAVEELDAIQQEVREVTDGEITSVRSPRMRVWVWERVGPEARRLMTVHKDGEEKQSIDKTVRAALLILAEENPDEVPPDAATVIQCADDLWASSVAKFVRMAALADVEDHRVRGAFVFAGGAATGRASSYGLQVHNFARKVAKDPQAVRHAMCRGHQIVPAFGKRVTDVLKGMLRPALIPAAGKQFVVADWSAIEGRVNPWLAATPAGDAKLEAFRRGLDAYIVNAAATFSTSYDAILAGYEAEDAAATGQRQIGKVQELACLAEETKVLTHNGVKAIVDVLPTDRLWDGTEWVTHQGVIYKGMREVINGPGVQVTADHLLKVNRQWVDAKTVLSSPSILISALATASENLPSWVTKRGESVRVANESSKFNVHAALNRITSAFTTCSKVRLPGATHAQKKRLGIGAKTFSGTQMLAQMMSTVGGCLAGYLPARTDATTPKIKAIQTMGVGGFIYMRPGALTKPRSFATLLRLTDGTSRIWNLTVLMSTRAMNLAICGLLRGKSTAPTNAKSKICSGTSLNLKPVFDILNSGPNNQFTILSDAGPLIVHNCGFGGGVGAFAAMGRVYGVNLPEHEAKRMVGAWRKANPWAPLFWSDLERAYMGAMRRKNQAVPAGRVSYLFDGLHLWYALPSGRILCYPHARLDADGISYAKASWKPAADAKEWPRARLWPGLACENVTQAAAHDILRYALRELEREGEDVVLHVHDEIVCETSDPARTTELMKRVMTNPPAWAAGLPLGIGIKTMERYGK